MTEDVFRQIEVCCLSDRHRAFVRADAVAAVVELKPDGPTRLLFAAGGYLDVCGSAETLRRKIRIAEIRSEVVP